MSDRSTDPGIDQLLGDLTRSLRRLEREVAPGRESGLLRPPTPRELARFTSEVGIPAAVLVLRMNIETLRLLQRTLRLAQGSETAADAGASAVADRTRQLTRASLDRLDGALEDLQAAMEGRPSESEASELVARTRELREEVDARLEEQPGSEASDAAVDVDVEAELDSIRRAIDVEENGDGDDGQDGDPPEDGADS